MDFSGPPTTHQRKNTILIADDDPAILTLLANVLRMNNFAVVTACDGAQALAAARDHGSPIDLLLTDFEMPHLNGIQLAAAIRQLSPRVSVVLMSGLSNLEAPVGSDPAFLKKPFTPLALLETITTLLGKPESLR